MLGNNKRNGANSDWSGSVKVCLLVTGVLWIAILLFFWIEMFQDHHVKFHQTTNAGVSDLVAGPRARTYPYGPPNGFYLNGYYFYNGFFYPTATVPTPPNLPVNPFGDFLPAERVPNSENVPLVSGGVPRTMSTHSAGSSPPVSAPGLTPALVIMVHNRPEQLDRFLKQLAGMAYLDRFTVYISCDDAQTQQKIEGSINAYGIDLTFWYQNPTEYARPLQHSRGKNNFYLQPYFKISRHFDMALSRVFRASPRHSHVVMFEDDLALAPDALYYFLAAAPVLDEDPSLWCVSAWNDNALDLHPHDQNRFFRTDFFPGLGWMINRQLWEEELEFTWPTLATTGWDHWMRLDAVHKGRSCVVPEVPRTQHVGQKGTNIDKKSAEKFARFAFASAQAPAPHEGNVSSLVSIPTSEDAYNHALADLFKAGTILDMGFSQLDRAIKSRAQETNSEAGAQPYHGVLAEATDVVIIPYLIEDFARLAPLFNLWPDDPRGTYQGVTITRWQHDGNVVILFADRRKCSLLPRTHQRHPSLALQVLSATRGYNCDMTCKGRNLQCSPSDFPFINTCEYLAAHFECTNGCGHQIGAELPAFAVDAGADTQGQCLTTHIPSGDCSAAHSRTARLCPCIPP